MRIYYRWFTVCVVSVVFILILKTIYQSAIEVDDIDELHIKEPATFQWRDLKGYRKCRNSAQGHRIIADDRGFICEWSDRLSTGCCFPEGLTAKRFHCHSCQMNDCCSIYEHCVSCCQHPNKKSLLEKILANTTRQILKRVEDQFEYCLVKCRTSSESVVHENHYRNMKYKHCYGSNTPLAEP